MNLCPDPHYPAESKAMEASQFRPFICLQTRFAMAVGYSVRSQKRDVSGILTWLREREPLFRRYCLQSVQNQTLPPDLWQLGFRAGLEDDAEGILGRISHLPFARAAIQAALPDDGTGWKRRFEHFTKTFSQHVKDMMPDGYTHLLTLRLDNDDCIHPNYIAAARDYCHAAVARRPDVTDMRFSFPFGIQVEGEATAIRMYTNGPFLGRLERLPAETVKTAAEIEHTALFDKPHARVVLTTAPAWAQIIHGANVSNAMGDDYSYRSFSAAAALRDFGIS